MTKIYQGPLIAVCIDLNVLTVLLPLWLFLFKLIGTSAVMNIDVVGGAVMVSAVSEGPLAQMSHRHARVW
jgi:hypothetical protein